MSKSEWVEAGGWLVGGGLPGLSAALQRPLLSLLEFNSNDQALLSVRVCTWSFFLFFLSSAELVRTYLQSLESVSVPVKPKSKLLSSLIWGSNPSLHPLPLPPLRSHHRKRTYGWLTHNEDPSVQTHPHVHTNKWLSCHRDDE